MLIGKGHSITAITFEGSMVILFWNNVTQILPRDFP